MALKNPGELFGRERKAPKEPSVDESKNINGIKENLYYYCLFSFNQFY